MKLINNDCIAAMADTYDSTKRNVLEKHNPYWTSTYQDIINAVERELRLRSDILLLKEELTALKIDHEKAIEKASDISEISNALINPEDLTFTAIAQRVSDYVKKCFGR